MIKYNYEVSVNENRAKLNKDIFLFRGNRNIHYYFSIKGARFTFSKENEDLLESSNAIYAAVTVVKPNGVEVANAIAPVEDGLIHLKVTEDLIDEEVEVGDFDLVFDLFDDNEGAVTIPKIKGQFHVQERPCTTSIGTLSGNVNVVNQAVVDLAIATQENEQLIVVDDDGKYVKTTWVKGDKISIERLNKIEEGIEKNSTQYKDIANKIDNIGTGGGSTNTEESVLKNKKLVSFGDSITWQDGNIWVEYDLNGYTAKGYQSYAVEELGLIHTNKGVSNTTLAKTTNSSAGTPLINSFENSCPSYLSDVDIITIAHGTNDLSSNVPIGDIGAYNDTSFDLTTFYGAYRHILNKIITTYPKIRIILCTPIHKHTTEPSDYLANGSGHYLRDYANAIIELGKMYSLPVCDFYNKSGLNQYNYATFFPDGVHPNTLGYSRMGGIYVDTIKSLGKTGFLKDAGIYTITNTLTGCSNSNGLTTVLANRSYSAIITANTGYVLENVKVTMGGVDITSSCYNNGTITINNVTGNIVIIATATETVEEIPITGIVLNKDTATIYTSKTLTLNCSLLPSNTTQTQVTWSSSNNDVATVNNDGLVTAITTGDVVISCVSQSNSSIKSECLITVKALPNDVIEYTNLFDKNDILTGQLFSPDTGVLETNSQWNTSNYIEVNEGDTIIRNTEAGLIFFDSNKQYLSSVLFNIPTATVPTGAKYCASHFKENRNLDSIIIAKLDYLADCDVELNTNLITTKITTGYYDGGTGVFTESDTFNTSDYIKVFPLKKFELVNGICVVLYDKDKIYLGRVATLNHPIPCDVRYVTITYDKQNSETVQFSLIE